MVKVTLVASRLGTPIYHVSLRFVVGTPLRAVLVRTTICSMFVLALKLLAKYGADGGAGGPYGKLLVPRLSVKSTLPFRPYSSNNAAPGLFVLMKPKKVFTAGPGGKLVVSRSPLVSQMMVGAVNSVAMMVYVAAVMSLL